MNQRGLANPPSRTQIPAVDVKTVMMLIIVQRPRHSPNVGGSKFLPTFQLGVAAHGKDFSKVTNEQCAKQTQQHVSPSEILVLTDNIESSNKADAANTNVPTLHVKFGKEDYYGFDFMRESWSRLDHPNQMDTDQVLKVRTIDIIPDVVERPILSENEAATESEEQPAKEVFYSIDNEAYEVKPIRISLMPQAVPMYIM
jgi:acylglycerol kinase